MNGTNRLLLQFHITGKCNLRCKHCYREEGNVQPLSFSDVINVLEQFRELAESYNRIHGITKKAHINITGGEPFIREDIKEILSYFEKHKDFFTFGVLSNGSFIDDALMISLKNADVSFVQLSIDGDMKTHDSLRADGDYIRVLNTAEHLEKNGIRTYISFTANKQNYKHLPSVARECRKRGITKLWSDRLVPIGNGEELSALAIDSCEFPKYVRTLYKSKGNIFTRFTNKKTSVTCNRALQFLYSDGNMYSCSAGKSLITVDEFGRIMPCRRLPIYCGDIFTSTLSKVYFNNTIFKTLRQEFIPDECMECNHCASCMGGAKCQSYAFFGNLIHADPACPFASGTNTRKMSFDII